MNAASKTALESAAVLLCAGWMKTGGLAGNSGASGEPGNGQSAGAIDVPYALSRTSRAGALGVARQISLQRTLA